MSAHTNIGRRFELVAALLDHEATSGRGMGVVSVATRVGREKSQISRGLASLVAEGLVDRGTEHLEFSIGPALLAIAAEAGDRRLRSEAQAVLESLVAVTGERADLAVLSEGTVLTVESIAGSSSVQSVGWVGRRVPVHCSAAGRALACGRPNAEVDRLIGPDPLPPAGPSAPTRRAEFYRRLRQADADGVAVADGELDEGVIGIAAPVIGATGEVVAAVTVAGPVFRVRAVVDDLVAEVLAAARRLSIVA